MVEEPGGEVDAGAVAICFLRPRWLFTGEERREVLQIPPGHHADVVRHGEDLRPPVRSLHRVVALPREGAVEFPDPGGVVVRGIDGDGLVGEEGVEGRECPLHKRGGRLVIIEVHPVEEVGAVARVRPDGRGEALLREVGRDPLRSGKRRVVLGVRGRDAARPDRVDIHREPAPADNIGVGRSGVFAGEPHLDPVCPAGEEGRVHGVESDVDPGDRGVGVEGLDGPGERLVIVEVARVGDAVGECPDLDHAAIGGKYVYRGSDLVTRTSGARAPVRSLLASQAPDVVRRTRRPVAHPVTPGTRGKRGAEMASPRATRWKLTSGMM